MVEILMQMQEIMRKTRGGEVEARKELIKKK